jgi:TonB family protein
MRVQFAIIFSLICTSAVADDVSAPQPTDVTSPVPISSHRCDLVLPTAKKGLLPGDTRVSFLIDTDGDVHDVHINQSSGVDWIDQEGALCAAKWRYKPATRNGKPVDAEWKANIDWHRH